MARDPVTASAVVGVNVMGMVSCWPAVRVTGSLVMALPPTADVPRANGTGEAVEEMERPVTSIVRAAVTVGVRVLAAPPTRTDPKLTCPLTSGRAFETPKPYTVSLLVPTYTWPPSVAGTLNFAALPMGADQSSVSVAWPAAGTALNASSRAPTPVPLGL